MFWKIIQTSVMFAVLGSNIHYQWMPNPYATGVLALLAAALVTAIPIAIVDLMVRTRRAVQTLTRFSQRLGQSRNLPVYEKEHPPKQLDTGRAANLEPIKPARLRHRI
jgi:hypothetical protein